MTDEQTKDRHLVDDIEVARSIRFPKSLWQALDADAKAANRSSLKQMETILSLYYDLMVLEVDEDKLDNLRAVLSDLNPKASRTVRVRRLKGPKKPGKDKNGDDK